MKKVIATPFYYSSNTTFVNSKNKSFEIYHNCIIQLFSQIKSLNKEELDLMLFVNKDINSEFREQLSTIGVRVVIVSDCKYSDENNIENKFPGCLFLLDSIRHVQQMSLGDVLFLDSDIFVNKPIDLKTMFNDKVSFYTIPYEKHRKVNGRSVLELNNDSVINMKYKTSNIKYCGGEYVYIPKNKLNDVCERIEFWFDYYNSIKACITEEHILSQVKHDLIDDSCSISEQMILKRVWNTGRFNNIEGNEEHYILLHMPAEKDKGFKLITDKIKNNKLISLNDFNLYSNRLMYLLKRIKQEVSSRNVL
ncbi:hypothetical protein ACT35X_004792 [Enterobacter hormaechei]|uniref:hypothetical protein n=1 Tax=Enterobacteriaceae TaxID=543 RepID=UPI00200EF6E0|nr:hypothetical protein [Escherichia coli]